MNGTEKIIAHISAEAQQQSAAVLAAAQEKCEAIRAQYEETAKRSYAEKLRVGVKACTEQSESQSRIAQMESRKTLLTVKQDMVAKSFELAQEKITALPKKEYTAFLVRLCEKASVTGTEEIVLNVRDQKLGKAVVEQANKLLKNGALTLSKETGDFAGGLILRRGAIETNCTVEKLIELSRGEIATELAKLLFD